MKRSSLTELANQSVDVLVIGGGVTGAATARDAALRGLSVCLVEKGDFAGGTSSRSTKLIHGGLRYLEQFEFKLVREACHERELMLRLAPHLSHPRPFIYLNYDGYPEGMFKLNVGLSIYDWFSGNPRKRRHHMLSAVELLREEPHLNPKGLHGGGWYYDSLTDDARLTIDTLKAACDAGAKAANYMEVTGFVYRDGRIAGVKAADGLTGEQGEIRALQVINATGVWSDEVRLLENPAADMRMRPAKGVHIVLSKEDFPLNHAVFLRAPRDRRVVWPIPSLDGDLVYVGTTDTDYRGPLDHVVATRDDVDYLLEVANHTIPGRNLTREHVVAAWAGLRPLVKPDANVSTSKTSREHQILLSKAGLLTIAGGKLTTSRVMGLQVVDAAVRILGELFGRKGIPGSVSHQWPLSGGELQPDFQKQVGETTGRLHLSPTVAKRLSERYGSNFFAIAGVISQDSSAAQAMGGHDVVAAEVRYAVQEEMARTLTDFMDRRSALLYWNKDGGADIATNVAAEMGRFLGWDPAEQQRQVSAYHDWVVANRAFPTGD